MKYASTRHTGSLRSRPSPKQTALPSPPAAHTVAGEASVIRRGAIPILDISERDLLKNRSKALLEPGIRERHLSSPISGPGIERGIAEGMILRKEKPAYYKHRWNSDDTYWSLARKIKIIQPSLSKSAAQIVKEIRRANPDLDPTQILEGTVINLPYQTRVEEEEHRYLLEKGKGLYSIAVKIKHDYERSESISEIISAIKEEQANFHLTGTLQPGTVSYVPHQYIKHNAASKKGSKPKRSKKGKIAETKATPLTSNSPYWTILKNFGLWSIAKEIRKKYPSSMTVSESGIRHVKGSEKFVDHVYLDSAGYPTVGTGF